MGYKAATSTRGPRKAAHEMLETAYSRPERMAFERLRKGGRQLGSDTLGKQNHEER